MDLLADLTPPQREAVIHVNGPLLVLAGAGSGKTRVITRRVAHLLHKGVAPHNILALTFTNKAAGEMRERIEALIPGAKVWVGTFHGFCARLLRAHGSLVGLDSSFTIYDQADRLRAVRDVLDAMGVDEPPITPEKIEGAISRAKNDLATPKSLAHRARDDRDRLVAKVYAGYEEKLRAASAVDFDDLLVHVVKILKEHRDVRADLDARYRYVLVDEYQDTNMAQYAIVRALSVDHPNLCVTGDPDQSIYGWRGANLSNILEFEKDYDGVKVVKLEHNYRSTKTILAVADHLIQYNVNRKPKDLITENPSGEPVQVTVYARETEEAEGVAGRIASLVREGAYNYSDVAVFCRITALTRTFEQAFRSARIPYQIVGGVSFYERQEVKDVVSFLNLINNPKDDLALSRVVNVPPRGLGKTSFDHLIAFSREHGLPLLEAARRAREVPGLKEKAIRSFLDFVTLFDELAGLRDHPAETVILQTMEKTGYRQHLKDESRGEGEDRLANLEELITAAREFDHEHPGATIQDFLAEITLASPVDRWDQQTGAVTLMTLHAAKGLEFPVVFIIGLEEGLLPHSRAFENPNELEEERRLFFVGITRARKELYISRCRIRTFRGQQQATAQSRFLMELPEDFLSYDDRSGVSAGDSRWAQGSWDRRPASPPRRPPSSSPSQPTRTPTPSPSGFRLTTAAQLGGGGAAGPMAPPGDLDAFRPGASVLHPQYGLGRVVAIEGAGPNRKGRIAFTLAGERTFVLAKSPLKVVGKTGAGPR
ncbi:ATP-dependent helicase [Paludisphaera soli]|uniref:ATP-dependent helicase n=1 Tax=Paludisphaera soli TaxID=2712865 RepID=UPI0013EA7F42|nr:UvrD-helicase domain-containing protein [Paludisphaera soli]